MYMSSEFYTRQKQDFHHKSEEEICTAVEGLQNLRNHSQLNVVDELIE